MPFKLESKAAGYKYFVVRNALRYYEKISGEYTVPNLTPGESPTCKVTHVDFLDSNTTFISFTLNY